MKSDKQYHNLNLSELEFLPKEILDLLGRYNIYTISQFLSATRGMTRTTLLDEIKNKEELISLLLQFIPEDIIELYRNYSEEHPTGLLKLPKNESNTDTI